MRSTVSMDAARYLGALKALLKERRITYAMLAEELGCSLATVKRTLNSASLPLSRLLEIGDVAGFTIEDLVQYAERLKPRHFAFTDEQDALFSERDEMLRYFWRLAVDGKTPAEIANEYDLDDASTDVYLSHLERIGLIERRDAEKIRILPRGPYGFEPRSRYLRKKHKAYLETTIAAVLDESSENFESAIFLKPLTLSREDYLHMIDEFESVVSRFSAVADRSATDKSALNWQVAFVCGPAPDQAAKGLPRITS